MKNMENKVCHMCLQYCRTTDKYWSMHEEAREYQWENTSKTTYF
jgi:hypothetical protein